MIRSFETFSNLRPSNQAMTNMVKIMSIKESGVTDKHMIFKIDPKKAP